MEGFLCLLFAAALAPGLLLGRAGGARLFGGVLLPDEVNRGGLFPQTEHVPQQRVGLQTIMVDFQVMCSSF